VDGAQFGLHAGPFASTQDPDEDEDGVPQVTELLRLDVELLPLREALARETKRRREEAERRLEEIEEELRRRREEERRLEEDER
jgi:hypothetical protein